MKGSQFGGMGWMPPWMMPPWMMQEPQQQIPDSVVPARVREAREFLGQLYQKQADRAAASEMSIEIIPGQKLCSEEEAARDSACQCIAKYFDGKLSPDETEKLRYQAMKKRVELGGKEGNILRCIVCGPSTVPNPHCNLCKGTGKIMVLSFGTNDMLVPDDDEPSE